MEIARTEIVHAGSDLIRGYAELRVASQRTHAFKPVKLLEGVPYRRDGALCDHRACFSRRCCRFGLVLRVMVVPAVVAGDEVEELP